MRNRHGSDVGRPYNSLLNQLPQRPIACANARPGAAASANATTDTPARRAPIQAPTPPSATAPQMPRPPSQILKAFHGSRPGTKYNSGSVIRWYSRPPRIPNGIAHQAIVSMAVGSPPPATQRLRVSHKATPMPARMHRAYPRIGKGPRCQTPCIGLGMANAATDTPTIVAQQPGHSPATGRDRRSARNYAIGTGFDFRSGVPA